MEVGQSGAGSRAEHSRRNDAALVCLPAVASGQPRVKFLVDVAHRGLSKSRHCIPAQSRRPVARSAGHAARRALVVAALLGTTLVDYPRTTWEFSDGSSSGRCSTTPAKKYLFMCTRRRATGAN